MPIKQELAHADTHPSSVTRHEPTIPVTVDEGSAPSAQRAMQTPYALAHRDVAFLQRTIGNRSVGHRLQHGIRDAPRAHAASLTPVVQREPADPAPPAAAPTAPAAVTADQVVVTNNGQGVTADAIQVLQEIVASIGETSATITSGRRTPSEQAAAMYTNLESTGVAAQKALYGSSGDKVIDVYEAGKAAEPPKDAATITQEMTDKINELGPSTVSNHCSDNSVIDVAPSSITNDAQFQTKAQAHARVTKYLGPATTPSDPAHHLEIS